jgi:hypothetical protein
MAPAQAPTGAADVTVPATHATFTDETQYNVGRVRGLGMVSAPAEDAAALAYEVRSILSSSRVREWKWEKLRSAKTRFAGGKLLRWTVDRALAGALRIDTLTWDVGTSRPQSAPHMKRLHAMYADLLGRILPLRWLDAAAWRIYPDEQDALDWPRIARQLPYPVAIMPSRSGAEPLIQLADLFAGLAVYSRDAYATYERWLGPESAHFSASERHRCALLDEFWTESKYRGLGVSLRTNRGLRTYDATRPICFWWSGA